MVQRHRAIMSTSPHVDVVLASDYDALWTRFQDLQDRYDRLLAWVATRGFHRSGCEQDGGEPYCKCAVMFERAYGTDGEQREGGDE